MVDHKFSEKTEPTIDERYDFYKYFGEVISHVFQYFRHEIKWYQKNRLWMAKMDLPQFFEKTNEIIEKYIPVWKTLKTYSHGRICFHVYKMFYVLLKDPDYQELNKHDKNILLWATLLHDICKRGTPVVNGKDPVHPFKSAWATLYIFNDTFKFCNLTEQDLKEWDSIFEDAYTYNGKEIQNHHVVPRVKEFLDKKLPGKEWEIEVIWYVMLHQSVPTLRDHPHQSLLEPLESEVKKYFSKRTLKIFGILLRNDSLSYLIYGPKDKRKQYGKEIDENVEKIKKYLEENE